jgi:hypothetical protein
VEQFVGNDYDRQFYSVNKAMSIAEYKKNYWVKDLENKVDFLKKQLQQTGRGGNERSIPYGAKKRDITRTTCTSVDTNRKLDGSQVPLY